MGTSEGAGMFKSITTLTDGSKVPAFHKTRKAAERGSSSFAAKYKVSVEVIEVEDEEA